jgi:hypothetical protein
LSDIQRPAWIHPVGRLLLSLFLLSVICEPAPAHPLDDSRLALAVDGARVELRWEISLRDLDAMVDLDRDRNNRISAEEHQAGRQAIETYVRPHLRIEGDGSVCDAGGAAEQSFAARENGSFVTLRYALTCPAAPSRLNVSYDLFAKEHPAPRTLVTVTAGRDVWTGVMSDEQKSLSIDLGAAGQVGFASFFLSGVLHMLEGIDHLLFLAVLLLPLMLAAGGNPVHRIVEAAKILTAFTLAHGLTLWLAALGIVDVSSRLVESVIALSIAVTAADNVRPFLGRRRWLVAFGFGLVHGLGFASALGPLSLPPFELGLSLLAFNLGLEAAQLGVALIALPLGYALGSRARLRRVLLPMGSAAAGVVAMLWFAERAFDLAVFS